MSMQKNFTRLRLMGQQSRGKAEQQRATYCNTMYFRYDYVAHCVCSFVVDDDGFVPLCLLLLLLLTASWCIKHLQQYFLRSEYSLVCFSLSPNGNRISQFGWKMLSSKTFLFTYQKLNEREREREKGKEDFQISCLTMSNIISPLFWWWCLIWVSTLFGLLGCR